jgi:hypothetical protein
MFELVFSGTVGEINAAGNDGVRVVVFQVDRSWKGMVPRRVELYVDPTDSELPSFNLGRRYLVLATQMDSRHRRRAGLADSAPIAFRVLGCGGLPYEEIEQLGIVRELGPGEAPK